MMTPAEELRAAAAKLREMAADATEGPWTSVPMRDHTFGIWSSGTGLSGEDDHLASANVAPDAASIALMCPDKAELLAVWLEEAALSYDLWSATTMPNPQTNAVEFARSVLGEKA